MASVAWSGCLLQTERSHTDHYVSVLTPHTASHATSQQTGRAHVHSTFMQLRMPLSKFEANDTIGTSKALNFLQRPLSGDMCDPIPDTSGMWSTIGKTNVHAHHRSTIGERVPVVGRELGLDVLTQRGRAVCVAVWFVARGGGVRRDRWHGCVLLEPLPLRAAELARARFDEPDGNAALRVQLKRHVATPTGHV